MVDKKTYWKLYPRGSQPGRIYGMAKNHKKDCPLRPVLSAINTAEYELSKWLEVQIKPYYNGKWSVSSTQEFVRNLGEVKPKSTDILVSFDIRSLYTNVPLNEVIDDVTNAMYDAKNDSIFYKHRNKLTSRVFKNMLRKCSENIFLYRDEVYRQTDGLSMGSPLAPLLANWFVAKLENAVLEDSSFKKPISYQRYVDDIFAVFETIEERDEFFLRLNNAHKSLDFTIEEVNQYSGTLPFLDTEVRITGANQFETKVYRKPTNTNVLLHYEATTPQKWKRGLIKCLLHRASRVTSTKELLDEEVMHLTAVFRANGYPNTFVNKIVDEHLNKVTETEEQTTTTTNKQVMEVANTKFFVLPYIGRCSEKLFRKRKHELQLHDVDLRPAYRATKVGSYFGLKSGVPTLFKADVVYKFQCPRDDGIHRAEYIGETQRQLFQRISEHLPATSKSESAVCDHIQQCNECQTYKNIVTCFRVIRVSNSADVLSEEALCIRKFEPSLNIQMGPSRGARVSTNIFS